MRLTRVELRQRWLAAHGLTEPGAVSSGGWLHAIGGADVYVSGLARAGRMERYLLDDAIASGVLRVVPGARGCTMLVPAGDAPVALGLANHLGARRRQRDQEKLGVDPRELADLGEAILESLAEEEATTTRLRKLLPAGAARSLGDAGKKLGVSSTLPMALRGLEGAGRIQRSPVGGRLDVERYQWRRPSVEVPVLTETERILTEVGRCYFQHAGPATLQDFVAWSGLTKRDAKRAVEGLDLQPCAVEECGQDYLARPGDAGSPCIDPSQPMLLGMRDAYYDHRDGVTALVESAYLGLSIPGTRGDRALGTINRLWQRCVLIDGLIAGFWEYDPSLSRVRVGLFAALDPAWRDGLSEACEHISRLLRDELGHARVYAMEPKATRAKSLAALATLPVQIS